MPTPKLIVNDLGTQKINGHGGSRNAGMKLKKRDTSIPPSAGDWMKECHIPKGIDVEQLLSDDLFSFRAQMLDDGYSMEEILSPEDMYPSMYNRVMGG